MTQHPLISYIFPIYNEAENIPLLYQTLNNLLASHPEYEYEIIFVNDGSRDNSLELLYMLADQDARILVIDLSRNYGHQLAVTAGLDNAHGDAVIIMDSDMQDPPAVSFELIEKWRQGYDVVYAQRRTRKDTPFKRATAFIFYRFLHLVTDIDIPRNTGDFRLVDRQVLDQVNQMREHSRFLRGMFSYVGFRQAAVQFDRDERHAGETGYPLRKMLKFAGDGILSFSTAPLRLITRIGFAVLALGIALGIWVLYSHIARPGTTVPGWSSLMLVTLGMSGIQMILMGVIGAYVGRTYTETQRRPLYLVQQKKRATRP